MRQLFEAIVAGHAAISVLYNLRNNKILPMDVCEIIERNDRYEMLKSRQDEFHDRAAFLEKMEAHLAYMMAERERLLRSFDVEIKRMVKTVDRERARIDAYHSALDSATTIVSRHTAALAIADQETANLIMQNIQGLP